MLLLVQWSVTCMVVLAVALEASQSDAIGAVSGNMIANLLSMLVAVS